MFYALLLLTNRVTMGKKILRDDRTCIICNTPLIGIQRMYCSGACKGRAHRTTDYTRQQERGARRKRDLVDRFGGCCTSCGYAKNYAALVFHHKDPADKSFTLDHRTLSGRKWASLVTEADKCLLLCANCHREHHNPHLALLEEEGLYSDLRAECGATQADGVSCTCPAYYDGNTRCGRHSSEAVA